ncbi:hypothetical protein T09_15104 [Trichinella sp. T9]|uniref:Uncharacterized protein n=1 Tax=Trichinella murrelli TaxID=144512 RepID=A0A0V0U4A9_9BILA|nr:hypothetical protein T05_9447 [Trichinella murrelli]KRX58822.1 hypothetical protein T09_15104 [Trichinella sp. T9]
MYMKKFSDKLTIPEIWPKRNGRSDAITSSSLRANSFSTVTFYNFGIVVRGKFGGKMMAANSNNLAELVIRALLSIVSYYSSQNKNCSSPDLFALRFIEGQSPLILKESNFIRGAFENDLIKLQENVSLLAERRVRCVRQSDAEIFAKTEYFFRQFTFFPKRLNLQPVRRWRQLSPELAGDASSDSYEILKFTFLNCVSKLNQVMKCSEINGKSTKTEQSCNWTCDDIPEECYRYLLHEKRLQCSHLVGRVLLTVAFEVANCLRTLQNHLRELKFRDGLIDLRTELCSNLFYLLENRYTARREPEKQEPLGLAMQFACGHLGYYEFLRLSWLPLLINGQHESGCYTSAGSSDKCDAWTTSLASLVLVSYLRCLGMNACDVTSGAGRPFEYYGDQQPEQVYNRSVLQELDMISTMNIKFNKISDFTLYWFILAVALFLFISIKLQSKKRPSSGIKQKRKWQFGLQVTEMQWNSLIV